MDYQLDVRNAIGALVGARPAMSGPTLPARGAALRTVCRCPREASPACP
jgi:hypothetical protein